MQDTVSVIVGSGYVIMYRPTRLHTDWLQSLQLDSQTISYTGFICEGVGESLTSCTKLADPLMKFQKSLIEDSRGR